MDNPSCFSKKLWNVDNFGVLFLLYCRFETRCIVLLIVETFLFSGPECLSTVKTANASRRKTRLFFEILLYVFHQNFREEERYWR